MCAGDISGTFECFCRDVVGTSTIEVQAIFKPEHGKDYCCVNCDYHATTAAELSAHNVSKHVAKSSAAAALKPTRFGAHVDSGYLSATALSALF